MHNATQEVLFGFEPQRHDPLIPFKELNIRNMSLDCRYSKVLERVLSACNMHDCNFTIYTPLWSFTAEHNGFLGDEPILPEILVCIYLELNRRMLAPRPCILFQAASREVMWWPWDGGWKIQFCSQPWKKLFFSSFNSCELCDCFSNTIHYSFGSSHLRFVL